MGEDRCIDMWVRVCKICGKEFETENNKRLCCDDKCSNINCLKLNRERKEKYKKKATNKELIDIAVKAKEAGVSYGQYVALNTL